MTFAFWGWVANSWFWKRKDLKGEYHKNVWDFLLLQLTFMCTYYEDYLEESQRGPQCRHRHHCCQRVTEPVLDMPRGHSQQTGSQGTRTGSVYATWTLSADRQPGWQKQFWICHVDSPSRQAAREAEPVLDMPRGLSQQTGSQGSRTGSVYATWILSADR